MDVMQLVAETLQEIDRDMESALDGLSTEEIDWRPSDEANSIGFNLWHNIRVEDHWISNFAMEVPETFQRNGWDRKWDMVDAGTGWGYGKEKLASFKTPPVDELLEYGREVRAPNPGIHGRAEKFAAFRSSPAEPPVARRIHHRADVWSLAV